MKNIFGHNFTAKDQAILRDGINKLGIIDRQVMIYRFWENYSIQEIAESFDMTWNEVDQSINASMEKLKKFYLAQKGCGSGREDSM